MSEQEIKEAVKRAIQSMPERDKILRIRLFGSQARRTSTPTSDVDLLVDFRSDAAIGYFELAGMQKMFEDALGMSVDLGTVHELRKEIRDDVLRDARTIYEG